MAIHEMPNNALHLTSIPLRSIAAGELYHSAIDKKEVHMNTQQGDWSKLRDYLNSSKLPNG